VGSIGLISGPLASSWGGLGSTAGPLAWVRSPPAGRIFRPARGADP